MSLGGKSLEDFLILDFEQVSQKGSEIALPFYGYFVILFPRMLSSSLFVDVVGKVENHRGPPGLNPILKA